MDVSTMTTFPSGVHPFDAWGVRGGSEDGGPSSAWIPLQCQDIGWVGGWVVLGSGGAGWWWCWVVVGGWVVLGGSRWVGGVDG